MKISYQGNLKTLTLHESGAKLETVAPDAYGKGVFFSPTDLLAISLGSCVLTLIGMTAKKLGLDVEGMSAEVEKEMSSTFPRRIGKISVFVRSAKNVLEDQREKLEHAALTCPVKETLHPETELRIEFSWGK